MNMKRFRLDIGEIAGISTWAVVFAITLYFILTTERFASELIPVSILFVLGSVVGIGAFVGFGVPLDGARGSNSSRRH